VVALVVDSAVAEKKDLADVRVSKNVNPQSRRNAAELAKVTKLNVLLVIKLKNAVVQQLENAAELVNSRSLSTIKRKKRPPKGRFFLEILCRDI